MVTTSDEISSHRNCSQLDKIRAVKDSEEGRKAGIGVAISSCLPAFLIEMDFMGLIHRAMNGYHRSERSNVVIVFCLSWVVGEARPECAAPSVK